MTQVHLGEGDLPEDTTGEKPDEDDVAIAHQHQSAPRDQGDRLGLFSNGSYRFRRPAPIARRMFDGVRAWLARTFPGTFDPPPPTPTLDLIVPNYVVANVLETMILEERPKTADVIETFVERINERIEVIWTRRADDRHRDRDDLLIALTQAECGMRISDSLMNLVVTRLFNTLASNATQIGAWAKRQNYVQALRTEDGFRCNIVGALTDGTYIVEVEVHPFQYGSGFYSEDKLTKKDPEPRFERRVMSDAEVVRLIPYGNDR